MERLTFVDEKGNVLFTPKGCDEDVGYTIIQLVERGHIGLLNEIANRLANHEQRLKYYEGLEEQGLLLKPPCKVGDTIWELCKCYDGIYRIFPMKVTKVLPYGSIRWIKGKEPTIWNVYAVSDYTDMYKSFYDFGRTVFLTQTEARDALGRMENEKEILRDNSKGE